MNVLRTCSIDGCERPSRARGWCVAHWDRWHHHGDPLAGGINRGEAIAFLQAAMSSETDECVIWPFARDSAGYGKVRIDGKTRTVSREVCIAIHGEPPTPKHDAAHNCGKGHLGCINHRHLTWKTRTENQADRLIHGTSNRGERCGTAKLTEGEVRVIRRLYGTKPLREIAEHFGVTCQTVYDIHRRKKWGWMADDTPTNQADREEAA